MGGGPVDVTAAKENTDVGAIMWCGYPGQSGGDAIADAIFGKTNPSGKLTMTWYPQHFIYNIQCSEIFTLINEKLHTET